jgi:hypothetical protein
MTDYGLALAVHERPAYDPRLGLACLPGAGQARDILVGIEV